MLLPRLKRKWSVNEVEIQIVEPESVKTRLESRFHALGPMIGIPQFCRDEDVLARNPSSGESCLQGLTHFTLVLVPFRTVEVSKSGFQRVCGSTDCLGCIGNQSAKSECRHLAASVVERYSRGPKIGRFDHDERLDGNPVDVSRSGCPQSASDSSRRSKLLSREIRQILSDQLPVTFTSALS